MRLFAFSILLFVTLGAELVCACNQKPNPHIVWPEGSDWDRAGLGDAGVDSKGD